MQSVRSTIFAATAIVASAISLGGCATKDYVNQQVAAEDTKAQAAQATLDQHQTHLGQLDQSTKDALDRATAAGKLAEGKFLYSMVLSDDLVKFPIDSSKLSPEAQQRLSDFADKLKNDNRNVYVEIQGHTDLRGAGLDQLTTWRGAGRGRATVYEPAWRALEPHGDHLLRKAGSGGQQQDPLGPCAEPPRCIDCNVLTPVGAVPGAPGRPRRSAAALSGSIGVRPAGPTNASRLSQWRNVLPRLRATAARVHAPACCGRLPVRRPLPT